MGWASGSEVMQGIIEAAKKYVPEEKRKRFYKKVIVLLEDQDCDTLGECLGEDPLFDKALREHDPDLFG